MKKIFGVLILGLLTMAAFSMRAIADDEVCCPGMKMGMHDKMFTHKAQLIMENAAELGLSDDQVQKIKSLKMSVTKSMIKSDADVELLVLDIEAALEKEEIDVNSTSALIDKKYNIKSQEAKTLIGAYADLKKVLSKDQMKKLHEIWNKEKMKDSKCMMMGEKGKMMGGKEENEHKMGMR
jgi:hypothetical protein